jgi:hypothetical protein
MMILPPAYVRPEAGMPPGLPGGAEPAPPAGWPAPPKAPPSGIPATDEEARVATPLEPAAVKVTVVCEKCLEKKIHEAVREERGDR